MKDVMLDFETLSTEDNALVVQIGAIYFNPETGELGNAYTRAIDIEYAALQGGHISIPTVLWWLKQDKDAQLAVFDDKAVCTPWAAFTGLNVFLENATKIWSHPTFDYRILEQHLKLQNIKPKFNYRAPRCIRTVLDFYTGPRIEFTGIPHNALDDCKHQVKQVVAAIKEIRNK